MNNQTNALKLARTGKVHHLKTWPQQFDAIKARLKPFEFRKNDRDYQVGDTLCLLKWNPEHEQFTGESQSVDVIYMLSEGFGIPEGYCIMGIGYQELSVIAAWDEVPDAWNNLYVAINHLMARLGAYGDVDSRGTESLNVMSALAAIDGGIVSKRALELHEKAYMPLYKATDLAIAECGKPSAQAEGSSRC